MVNKPSIVNYLEAGLKATTLRQKVVANNLANINTPNFRRSKVEFEKTLAEAMESPSGVDIDTLKPSLFQPMDTPVNGKGNDVNLDVEVGELMKVASRHKTYLKLLSKVYKQMEMAMESRT